MYFMLIIPCDSNIIIIIIIICHQLPIRKLKLREYKLALTEILTAVDSLTPELKCLSTC